jgi:hypothetical protein
MLRFHVDSSELVGALEVPYTKHILEGKIETTADAEEAVFSHPQLHDGLPGPPCAWLAETPVGLATLSPTMLADIAAATHDAALAAVAACAEAAGAHIIVWRTRDD